MAALQGQNSPVSQQFSGSTTTDSYESLSEHTNCQFPDYDVFDQPLLESLSPSCQLLDEFQALQSSSPLSVLSGYSDMSLPILDGVESDIEGKSDSHHSRKRRRESSISEPASQLSIGSCIVVEPNRSQRPRRA
jgi:hypothetical protein